MTMIKAKNLRAIGESIEMLKGLTTEELLAVHKAFMDDLAGRLDGHRVSMTDEERKAKKNEKQRAFRATPEGHEYANEASRKSLATKKRAEEIKKLMSERIRDYLEASKAKLPITNQDRK